MFIINLLLIGSYFFKYKIVFVIRAALHISLCTHRPYKYRCFEKLVADGFFEENQIDVVCILGGTNDSWANAPLGEEKYENWTKEDLYYVLPAICYLYSRVREVLPNAEIYGLANHLNMKQEIIDAIAHASEAVGGHAVILQNIETASSHPTEKGMIAIKDQFLAVFDEN